MSDSTEARRPEVPVTVVIPAYNLATYLPAAIESVLRQDYAGDVSIVVLDDGSSDMTWSVASDMAKSHPQVRCYTQSNQGRVGARNRLLQLAETEFVAWLDGDDVASSRWIRDQVDYLAAHSEVVAVSGQGYAMTATGRAIGPMPHPLSHAEIDAGHIQGDASNFFQSCVTTRKSAVEKAGSYRPDYPAGEDYDLWLRLAEFGKLANIDRTHLFYRVHSTSANWTIRREQRVQGQQIVSEARARRGLEPLPSPSENAVSDDRDDWRRRIYWINIALRSGNPVSALEMTHPALMRDPWSLLLWGFAVVAIVDSVLLLGNRTRHLEPGSEGQLGQLPWFSFYRFVRGGVRWRRWWRS